MEKDNTLVRLHEVLLEILTEFDRICRKHNIQYFLDSGTALGAVRHGGFIPWDDDIDVGMLRPEYEKFLAVAQNDVSDKFFVLTKETDPGYIKYHAKLVKKNTIFPERYTEGLKHRGIYIDIFPFDKTAESKIVRKKVFHRVLLTADLIRLKRTGLTKGKLKLKLLYPLLKLIPLCILEKFQKKIRNKYNATDSNFVSCYFYKMLVGRDLFFPISIMTPSKTINFAGKDFLIMNGVDEYLRIMYNNYMELPPLEKRTYHFEGNIVFDTNS